MEERPYGGSELFTVRVWAENVGPPGQPQIEWRGTLCHVAQGTAWHFRGWPALVDLLQRVAAERAENVEEPGGVRGEDRAR